MDEPIFYALSQNEIKPSEVSERSRAIHRVRAATVIHRACCGELLCHMLAILTSAAGHFSKYITQTVCVTGHM